MGTLLETVLKGRMDRGEVETEEEEVVEAEGRLLWRQLLLREDYKVLFCTMVDLVRFYLILVLHTLLYRVLIA